MERIPFLSLYLLWSRFPEWSKNQNEYDIAIYIANWPESRHNDWVNLLEERATENQVHVIAVRNCVGTDPAGITYRGGSCLLNPDGDWSFGVKITKKRFKPVKL